MEKKWKEEGFFFGEADFIEKMNTVDADFRRIHYQEGYFDGYENKKIHYTCVHNPEERAAIVISHGFCEFIGKYDEMIYYFYRLGYSVYFIDHRGHGFSYRPVEEPGKVHISDFEDYVRDFRIFLEQIVRKHSPDVKLFLFAHSMGGAIGTLFLEEYPSYFDAAVLSSPMMEPSYGKLPKVIVLLLAAWSKIVRWETRYVPGQHGFDHVYAYDTSSSLSEARYEYVFKLREATPEYQTYSATYGWTVAALKACRKIRKNAAAVQIPVLLCQAGQDTMVLPGAQKKFAGKSGNTTMERYPDSKHEIFNARDETRMKFYDKVFEFLEVRL